MAEIKCPIWEASQISPEEGFIVSPDGNLKFSEAEQLVTGTVERLVGFGWNTGDRVAVQMPNDWRCVILLFAMLRRGIVACPIDWRVPAEGVEYLMDRCGAIALITHDEASDMQVGGDRGVFPATKVIGLFSSGSSATGPAMLDLTRPATIIFTSGSCGEAKAVLHLVSNHYYNALGSNRNLRLRSKDRWLMSLPMHHVSGIGIVFRCCIAGSAIVFPDPAESISDAMYLHDPTHVSMVAVQLRRFLRERESWRGDRQLRAILVGGGPVPPGVLAETVEAGLPVFMTYGLTEMASQVTTVGLDTPPFKRSTSGRALRYGEVRIAKDGEIEVRGPSRFSGYVEGGDLVCPFDDDGWYATGDLGALDGEGFLTVHGRKDNMFVSGGENVYPEEIESVLCGMPGVEEAVVVAIDDDEFGKCPAAFVKSKGNEFNAVEASAALEEKLPKFKIPNTWHPWPHEAGYNRLKIDRSLFQRLVK